MSDRPKRPWYQFSLRTFLVVSIVASAGFGYWVHWSREWIRQRHEALESQIVVLDPFRFDPAQPPIALQPFAESGYRTLLLTDRSRETEMKRLFPEANVVFIDNY